MHSSFKVPLPMGVVIVSRGHRHMLRDFVVHVLKLCTTTSRDRVESIVCVTSTIVRAQNIKIEAILFVEL